MNEEKESDRVRYVHAETFWEVQKKKLHLREKLNILKQRMRIEDKEGTALIYWGTMKNKS